MDKLRVASWFSGIGAFEEGLKELDIDYDLVNYCEFEEYPSKAYSLIHNVSEDLNLGDINNVDETKLEDFDLMTYGFPCFTGNTLVLTDKGYKNIKDINVGDYVLDHNNEYNKVTNFMNQGKKEIWKIQGMGFHELKTTSNHRFLVREKNIVWNNSLRKRERKFESPKWIECNKLTKNHYLGVAINNNSKLPVWNGIEFTKHKNIKNELTKHFNDYRFWYLCGRYVGDGWLVNRKDRNNNLSKVVICSGKHKSDIFENKIGDIFNYTKVEERTTYKYHFSNKELAHFLDQFGRGAKNKCVPGFIFDLPVDLLKSFIEGYFDSDGHKDERFYKYVSISKNLIYGIAQCIAKVYKKPYSISKTVRPNKTVIENRIVNQNDTYELTVYGKNNEAFYEDGYIWFPIRSIENTHMYENVYDITVDESHSFTANGSIVHNCQSFSIAGKRMGFDDPEKGNLFFESMRIAKYKKPKFMVAENVKGLTNHDNGNTFKVIINTLEELGYNNYYKVCNSINYDTPQNRERIFIVSIRKDIDNGSFHFPKEHRTSKTVRDILDVNGTRKPPKKSLQKYFTDEYCKVGKYDSNSGIIKLFDGCAEGYFTSSYTENRIFSINGISPTLTTKNDATYYEIFGKLNHRERFALQGFKKEYADLLKDNGIPIGAIDKMSGNSITVNVIREILRILLKDYIVK